MKEETAKKKTAKTPKESKAPKKESPKSLNEALFGFQGENISIPRNGTGTVNGKTYKYATLDDTIVNIKPALQKWGLMFTQVIDGGKFITKIIHVASKEEMVGTLEIGNPSGNHDLGARITYLRRYGLTSMLGLTLEDDTDAQVNVLATGPQTGKTPAPTKQETVETFKKAGVAPVDRSAEFPPSENPGAKEESEAFKKAKGAIDSCVSAEALEVIGEQIGRSTRLSMTEIMALKEVIKAKDHELNGTIE